MASEKIQNKAFLYRVLIHLKDNQINITLNLLSKGLMVFKKVLNWALFVKLCCGSGHLGFQITTKNIKIDKTEQCFFKFFKENFYAFSRLLC